MQKEKSMFIKQWWYSHQITFNSMYSDPVKREERDYFAKYLQEDYLNRMVWEQKLDDFDEEEDERLYRKMIIAEANKICRNTN